MSPATLGTPRQAFIATRQAHRRALAARPRLWPHWGLLAELSSLLVRIIAELSSLDHVSGHVGDSSPSSRRSSSGSSPSSRSSTTSLATMGTPRRALVAPRQDHRRALIARPRLRPCWGLLTELSSLLVGSSPSSRRSTTSPVTLGTPRRALVITSH
jgi:hypothetical protein